MLIKSCHLKIFLLLIFTESFSCYFDFYLPEEESMKLYELKKKIYYIKENKQCEIDVNNNSQRYFNHSYFVFNWDQRNKEKGIFYRINLTMNQTKSNNNLLRLSIPKFGIVSDHVPKFILYFDCKSQKGIIEISLLISFKFEVSNYPEKTLTLKILRYRNCSRNNQNQFSFLQDYEDTNSPTLLGIIICGLILIIVIGSMVTVFIRRILLSRNINNKFISQQTEVHGSKKTLFNSMISQSLKYDSDLTKYLSSTAKDEEDKKNEDETVHDNDAESFVTSSSVGTHQTGTTPIIKRRIQDPLQILNEIQIPRSKIILKQLLLEGTFCQMYEAIMCQNHQRYGRIQKKVMIKTISDTSSISQAAVLIKDGTLLAGLKHHNLNPVIKACTASYHGNEMVQPPWLIYSYTEPGNLKLILQRNAYQEEHIAVTFSTPHLIVLAIQLVKAIKYLHERNIIHKDIATRNCFLNESEKVLLCDSALSRDTFPEDYQCLGDNENRPVKWLSVEALIQRRYSHSSDVWAFGVLLWELVTKAELPYSEIDPFEMPTCLRSGYRLGQPSNCPDNLWTIMHSCWNADSSKRPTIIEVMRKLKSFQTILTDFV
uniref:Uncharacterized protein n=1 Tax=Schmidtea mediterranea TaxID=79327 RepID=A0A1S6KMI1_SCHMD|nr:hypothetical protein Smed-ryk [Schmidtea mediterranea]